MGDHATYRRIMTELLIDGKPAHDITWRDHDGKLHRLTEHRPDIHAKLPESKLEEARRMQEQLRAARDAARKAKADQLESGGDGGD